MADTCPNCCHRGVPPRAERSRDGELRSAYRCPRCGHVWITARLLAAYTARHLRAVPDPTTRKAS